MNQTTSPTSSAVATSAPNPARFVFVVIDISVSINLGRHQTVATTPSFVAPDGTLTNNCGAAAQYNIVDRQFFGANGGQYSTNTGITNEPLVASTVVDDITRTFTAGGILTWSNTAFTGSVATYCTLASGQVLAVFDGTAPAGCTPVILETSTCAAVAAGQAAAGGNCNGAAVGTTTNNNINNIGSISNFNIGSININYNLNNSQLALNGGIIDQFNAGIINFYSADQTYYYAQTCPVCPIVQIYKVNNTYATQPCPVCPVEVMQCPYLSLNGAAAVGIRWYRRCRCWCRFLRSPDLPHL